jgi:hypothetical protein
MTVNPIMTNLVAIILLLIFAVLPAYYTNKFLLQLIRPKESLGRLLAHIIIILAAAIVYTSIAVLVLVKFVLIP